MRIDERSSVRELLKQHPATRQVFERHGLMGCGGALGPEEAVGLFARAHGVAAEALVGELRAAAEAAPAAAPPPPEEPETYRVYLRAAVLIGALAGAALGSVALAWLALWGYTGLMPNWEWWPALIQAHGNAQIYGWTGLFIIGVASHSLPRMLQRPAPSPALARAIFALILGGLLLGLFAQPLAERAPWTQLFPAAMALQWLGVTLFALYLLRTVRLPREPWAALVLTGTLWFWLAAGGRLWLSLVTAQAGGTVPPAGPNSAYLHVVTWGFLLCFVLGYSFRLLPVFLGLPPGQARAGWAAFGLLTAGAAGEALAILAGLPGLSLLAALLLGAGALTGVAALRLWARPVGEADPDARWLGIFARTAYFWLLVAAALLVGLRAAEAAGPVSQLHQHAFGGASRHAFTVGFVSLMIVGVAWRILPIFSGAPRAHPALVPLVFGLLVTGNTLRVAGQAAAGLWGGSWYWVMGASGWLETVALGLFAIDVLRLMGQLPVDEALPEAGEPVPLALDSPVGPLLAYRPWLLPVFQRHGLGQAANPLFQRTVGRRVTLRQACARFNLEPEEFLHELREAEGLKVEG